MNDTRKTKLRVGLLIDDFNLPIWVYKMIENINAGDFAEITMVVKKKNSLPVKKPIGQRIKNKLKNILFKLYMKMENRRKQSPDAFEEKDISELTKSASFLEVDCVEKKFSDYITEPDLVKIREARVDVFLRLGFRILRGGILNAARMGIWSYHHGDNFDYRGGPAGFWEYFKREKEIGSVLQILTEDLDGGEVLYRSWSAVDGSLNSSINTYYWKTSRFVPRKLKDLYELGEEAFIAKLRSENSQIHFYSSRNYTIPTNREFLKYYIPLFFDKVRAKFSKMFFKEQWILLYSFTKNKEISTSLFRYKRLVPPSDRYWADPFVVYKDGKHFLFFEEVMFTKGKEIGYIKVVEMGKDGFASEPVVVLKRPYHLSYPFVFEHEGNYYLIPESEDNRTIELYQARNFPYDWEFKMNLMENVQAVDATITYRDNKFWMFANILEVNGASYSEELFLFSSDTLMTKEWKSHPANPVVSDVKSSRPAGRIFKHNNKWYRPSQDCSRRYGYATVINEIETLNENEYKERKISHISPDWADDVLATHTIAYDNGLSVIDAVIRRRR